jgi:cbb3-type cytochrome oxidase maturation protein
MQSLYLLIPIALVLIILAVKLLFWAINNGQYDDLDTEGHRILFDEDIKPQPQSQEIKELKKND